MQATNLRGRAFRFWIIAIGFAAVFSAKAGFAAPQSSDALRAFGSEVSLAEYLSELKKMTRLRRMASYGDEPKLEEINVTGSRVQTITNNQTDGVDEGDIVKAHGNHLVILRRGRLFTVAIHDQELRPVAWINAFGPGMDPDSAWYDEMLIYQDRIVIIGYSYRHNSTDIGVFRIDGYGRLSYEATYQLRSNDYYSSRNYASRLIDGKLIFYTPLSLSGERDDFPAVRKWREFSRPSAAEVSNEQDEFQPIASARHIYRPARPLIESDDPTLHSVATCDLRKEEIKCDATVVIGPSGRTFYVSATAVYVWTGEEYWGNRESISPGVLYRMPLDGSEPTALQVTGMPIDQFSFAEIDGFLNVLVQSRGGGDRMWRSEVARGDLALLRVRVDGFGDGTRRIQRQGYRPLDELDEDCSLHNRFVDDSLLYGCGNSWFNSEVTGSVLHIVNMRNNRVAQLALPHGVDRIEVMGSDGVVIGTDESESLHFSGINLSGAPRVVQQYVIKQAAQGELRSHGFFYKPEKSGGVLGLPIRGQGAPGYEHLTEDSAAVVFLRNHDGLFGEVGRLFARPVNDENDDDADSCLASCVDWYGNARPIFMSERVFALLGYELVEGVMRGGKLSEKSRTTFAPLVANN